MTTPETVEYDTEPIDEALTRLISEDVYLFGHGTVVEEHAVGSLNDGLHTRHRDLFSTAEGLPTLLEDPDAFTHNKDALEHWQHLDAKYVVILGVERLTGEKVPHRRYLQSIVQPRPNSEDIDDAYDKPYAIDRRFIAGYSNALDGTFIRNPAFDPRYDPSLLETTVNSDIRRELDTHGNPLDILGSVAIAHHGEPTHPSEPIDTDGPTVW